MIDAIGSDKQIIPRIRTHISPRVAPILPAPSSLRTLHSALCTLHSDVASLGGPSSESATLKVVASLILANTGHAGDVENVCSDPRYGGRPGDRPPAVRKLCEGRRISIVGNNEKRTFNP